MEPIFYVIFFMESLILNRSEVHRLRSVSVNNVFVTTCKDSSNFVCRGLPNDINSLGVLLEVQFFSWLWD